MNLHRQRVGIALHRAPEWSDPLGRLRTSRLSPFNVVQVFIPVYIVGKQQIDLDDTHSRINPHNWLQVVSAMCSRLLSATDGLLMLKIDSLAINHLHKQWS